jgi:hypothetical protein
MRAVGADRGGVQQGHHYTFPRMLNEFGTRLKIVRLSGNSTMVVAMERGEVDGVTESWDSGRSLDPSWLTEQKINLLVQTEPKARDLDIPSVQELARNDEDRQVIALIISGDALGKPLAMTPNVPPERVKALRDAFDATVKDPEFIKAAAAARIEVNPIRGVALQSTVSKVLATPKHLVERALDHRRIGRGNAMGYACESAEVIDRHRHDLRARPVCVRQLATGAPMGKVDRAAGNEDFAARHEADFQNKHRNKAGHGAPPICAEEGRAILIG